MDESYQCVKEAETKQKLYLSFRNQAKFICGIRNQNSGYLWGEGKGQ